MAALVCACLLFTSTPGLGLGQGRVALSISTLSESGDDSGAKPMLLPEMPGEETARLRGTHPLLRELVGLARPIRETLREINLWNLRPDYRRGGFCISWEFSFSL